MNAKANIAEFRRLDSVIERTEAETEAAKWRQAELAAEAIEGGMTRVEYARQVDRHNAHISRLVQAWNRWPVPGQTRPRFADAYATIQAGSDELVTKADIRRRESERQMPTRHDDRVEMAASLMADPDVAKVVTPRILATPTPAARIVERAVDDKQAQRRDTVNASRQRTAHAGALPLPGHIARMIIKISEWTNALHGLVDDLDEIPDGEGRLAVLRAAKALAAAAQGWVDRLERSDPRGDVIDVPGHDTPGRRISR